MRFSLLLCLLGLWAGSTPAGAHGGRPTPPARATVRKHLIYFTDKAGTPYSVGQPQAFLSARALLRRSRQDIAVTARDLPVTPAYVAQVKSLPGVQLWYTSRWFNAAIVACDSTTLAEVRKLSFVRAAQTLNRPASAAPRREREPVALTAGRGSVADYGAAYNQNQMIGAIAMHEAGFRGEGMQIAVFDAGFPGVNEVPALAPLFKENRIASTFNVVDKSTSVYLRNNHGSLCLSTLAANQPGTFIGTAPKATYRLFITEDYDTENPIEEANWLVAAEYADSAGVDVISSSLGYYSFDNSAADYEYADLDGHTTLVTRAAVQAARTGMLVVNSAGNEGSTPWHYIAAPADADSILTVGAVNSQGGHAAFSSYGPTADGRIKPDVVAQGQSAAIVVPTGGGGQDVGFGNGTSFSCPITAGMATGLWQSSPGLTAQQVIQYLRQSGSQTTKPDNTLGYGIPDFVRAYNLANPKNPLPASSPAAAEALAVYPNPRRNGQLYLRLSAPFQAVPLTVRVFDARGMLVRTLPLAAAGRAEVRLLADALTPGMYTCLVSGGRRQQTVRFIQL